MNKIHINKKCNLLIAQKHNNKMNTIIKVVKYPNFHWKLKCYKTKIHQCIYVNI